MREKYFTKKSIIKQSSAFIESIGLSSDSSCYQFKSGKAALIVLDMQEFFLNPQSHAFIPSAVAILPGVQRIIKVFNDTRRPVIFTRHLNTEHDAGMMKVWWHDLISSSSQLSAIIPKLNYRASQVINKSQYDAFYNTSLADILRGEKVSQLVITGVMTHLCCESAARSAFVRGFRVFFPVDGTATYNKAFHEATLRNLSHGFAYIVTINEILEEMSADGGSC